FPLSPRTELTGQPPQPSERLPAAAVQFLDEAGAFLRKWQLSELVTWDLPLPQGPLSEIPLGVAAQLLGPDHVAFTHPSYYDIPSGTDLRGQVRDQQARVACDAGIGKDHPLTDIGPRDGRPSGYEAAFRLWLVEHAARQRYGERRGLVARLS